MFSLKDEQTKEESERRREYRRMGDQELTRILDDLEKVEKELKKAGDNKESRQKCYERLLELRKRMDHYVEFWLRFEEKINELQDKYDFLLPDELPESIISAFTRVISELPGDQEAVNPDTRGVKAVAVQFDREACSRSFRRGLGFMELMMLDEAINEFRQVVSQEPELLLARLCLGIAYSERGMKDEAMRELRLVQALTADPKTNAIIHNAFGNLYADQECYERALPEFEKAVELDPGFAAAWFNLGATYYNMKEYVKSLEVFEKVKHFFKRDWEVYFYLGKVNKKLGSEEEALSNFLKASFLAPGQPYVLFELGLAYEQLGEVRKALECYYRARKLYLEEECEGDRDENFPPLAGK